MTRIGSDDTPADAVFKLVDGDRSSAEACIAMVKAVATIDPKAEFGPFTPLLILDSIGLTGPDIGVIYGRVFRNDPTIALAVLHAVRLKLIPVATLLDAKDGKVTIDIARVLTLIRQRIPDFGR